MGSSRFGTTIVASIHDFVQRLIPFPYRRAGLRRAADKARAARNLFADATHRRSLSEHGSPRAGEWLQYGHSLKELGFFTKAEEAYRIAQQLTPSDPEIALQIGHLLKITDHLAAAAAAFREARALGYADDAHVADELEKIQGAATDQVFSQRIAGQPTAGIHFYLSAPSKAVFEDSRDDLSGMLGRSDYSYSFAMRGFAEALEQLGHSFSIIENPEYIVDISARSSAATNVHLAFYPPERMRLLKGAWNVACFAWEFERLRLPGEIATYHAFADQSVMLQLVDEIWVPSSEAAAVVGAAVEKPVRHVAAPILSNHRNDARTRLGWRDAERLSRALSAVSWQPLAVLPRIQGRMNEMAQARQSRLRAILAAREQQRPPVIFATVLNVHDFRKQLRPLIEGFLEFSNGHPDALLLIKMTTPDRGKLTINEFLLMDQISDAGRLVPPMVSERVWITDEFLTRDEMNALFDLADFYVCTPFAEGQNLPLIEAMARGCVPLSPDHTAMRDYVRPDNAIVVPSQSQLAEPRLTTRYGMWNIRTNVIDGAAVATALERAADMDDADWTGRSTAAQATVREVFGVTPFAQQIEQLTRRLTEVRA